MNITRAVAHLLGTYANARSALNRLVMIGIITSNLSRRRKGILPSRPSGAFIWAIQLIAHWTFLMVISFRTQFKSALRVLSSTTTGFLPSTLSNSGKRQNRSLTRVSPPVLWKSHQDFLRSPLNFCGKLEHLMYLSLAVPENVATLSQKWRSCGPLHEFLLAFLTPSCTQWASCDTVPTSKRNSNLKKTPLSLLLSFLRSLFPYLTFLVGLLYWQRAVSIVWVHDVFFDQPTLLGMEHWSGQCLSWPQLPQGLLCFFSSW